MNLIDVTTAQVADACVRSGVSAHVAPSGISPITSGQRIAGNALPVRHCGSVDVFLEALERSAPGDVLVVDNAGRLDEGCIGDLTILEARGAGLAGAVVWGAHRDHAELAQIALPVFSYGRVPFGPVRLDPRPPDAFSRALFGERAVKAGDVVFADDDGVLFVPGDRTEEILEIARSIRDVERDQAAKLVSGVSLRVQLRFAEFLSERDRDPALTFREHLRAIGGAMEE